jgi:hypothetical protein
VHLGFPGISGRGRPALHDPQLYYGLVTTLAQSVLDYIRRRTLLGAGDRVGVAVSGGAASVSLL